MGGGGIDLTGFKVISGHLAHLSQSFGNLKVAGDQNGLKFVTQGRLVQIYLLAQQTYLCLKEKNKTLDAMTN